ncbi:MAG: hypothetical protein ACREIP_13355 [Alphaproteobacteria bacterium]
MTFDKSRTRREAVLAIEAALTTLEKTNPTCAQVADLADAMDALVQHSYGVAVELAAAALRSHPQVVFAARPRSMAKTLNEIAREFGNLPGREASGGDDRGKHVDD